MRWVGHVARTGEGKRNAYRVISVFCSDVDEICALLGYYAASSGNPLPTFRDDISVPSARVKKSKKDRQFIFILDFLTP
jgi:hypothetical protein